MPETPETWACITDTGLVGNCIVATAGFIANYLPQSGFALILAIDGIDPRPGPGWTHDGETFIAPPPPPPPEDPDPPVSPPFQLDEDPASFINPLLYELESRT